MRPIATDGVAWSVCLSVGHVRELCKMAKPIKIQFGWVTQVGQRNHVLDEVQIIQGKRANFRGYLAQCESLLQHQCNC